MHLPTINILPQHVADLIAAGEVVERPASVIKELMENSFDAGAHNVAVEIRNGGLTMIRVSDDGCGMRPEDAGIAFIRHATSKLQDESGLAAIATLGFRGEALAAISSVSRMRILTREASAPEGVRVDLTAGELDDMTACGCPKGTSVTVSDLFYNTPARLKFLKSERSEASACLAAALNCALARPDVSVRFTRDGTEEFFSPGDGRTDSCIYSLLGREDAAAMLRCNSSLNGMQLYGFISSPAECRGNRAKQFFFVNGRFVRSRLLQTALEQAYANTMLVGRFPACVLYLELPFNSVDVNVHPAKTEVRFAGEKAVFDFVYAACRMALESEDLLARSSTRREAAPEPEASPDELRQSPPSYTQTRLEMHPGKVEESFVQNVQKPGISAEKEGFSTPVEKNVEKPVQNVETPVFEHHNILCQVFKTYIVIEHNGEILLIDKHAAHERILFDRLQAKKGEITSQLLLSPVTVSLSEAEAETLEMNGELLSDAGFEIEPYGRSEFVIRAVPAGMDPGEARAALEEILEKLGRGARFDPSETLDEIFHTVACKAAIKAGWDTEDPELQKLVSAVLAGEIRYCPHGRPIAVTVTRRDLDRLFKRIL